MAEEDGERKLIKEKEARIQLSNFPLQNLPETAIFEILARLPARDVFSTKCLSEYWYASDHFRDRIFVNAFSNHNPLSLIISDERSNLTMVEFKKNHRDYNFPLEKAVFPLNGNYHLPLHIIRNLLGSVGGFLFYLDDNHRIFMCNPLLGEYIVIPDPEPLNVISYGVGFSLGCYTLFKFARKAAVPDPVPPPLHPKCAVYAYTIGVDQNWRSLEDAPRPKDMFLDVSFNGKLFWIVDGRCGSDLTLSCFDLENGRLEAVPAPPGIQVARKDLFKSLVLVDGHLCLINLYDFDSFEIWSMGVQGEWQKKVQLRRIKVTTTSFYYWFKPITILNDGVILFGEIKNMNTREYRQIDYLKAFNPSSGKHRRLKFQCHGSIVAVFSPTFQSLHSIVRETMQVTRVT